LKPYESEIIHIAYHNSRPLPADPFYQSNPVPTEIRTNFYDVTASPSIVVNGVKFNAERPLLSTGQLERRLNQNSLLHLNIEETIQQNKERQIEINAKTSTDLPDSSHKLFVAVVEKDVFFCTYFEYIFDNVFRTFLSDNSGDEITLSNNEKSYTYKYSPQPDWEEDQLFVVAFVQNIETKEIINATLTQPNNQAKTYRYADEAFSLLSSVYDDVCGKNEGAIELDICVDTAPMENPVNLSFEWSNGATSQNISNLTPGMYSVKIKNNIHQTTTEQQYEVKGNEKIEVTIEAEPDTGTADGSIQVQALGGSGQLSIEWNTNDHEFTLQALQAGFYSFTVNDEKGCTYQQTIEVKNKPQINTGDIVVEVQDISCAGKNDGKVGISTTGNVPIHSVIWVSDGRTGDQLDKLSPGIYTFITLDDTKNKMHEGSFVIEEPAPLELNIKQSNGFEQPFIMLKNVTGGTPPYRHAWSTGSTDAQIDNIDPGEYIIELTDSRGCKQNKSITIAQNTDSIQQISCFGANDGSIEIIINDGLNYSFNWTNGQTQPIIKNLPPGRYGLTVKHESSSNFLSFDVVEPKELIAILQYNSDANPPLIEPDISGGTPPYQFLWNTSDNQPTIENPENGIYTLNLTDANACTNEASIEIKEETEDITSIENINLNHLHIYPNPVYETAFIHLPKTIHDFEFEVLSLDGRLQKIPYSIDGNQLQLHFNNSLTGVYIIKIMDSNNNQYSLKALILN